FMAQFGPALQWPWTKLTDVPEVTDELLDRLEAQSDEQAGGRSIAELERLRDDCLVSVLQALRGHDVGAGAILREWETALLARTTQVLGVDEKRLHVCHRILRGEEILATAEQMLLHVDAGSGRAGPAGAKVLAAVRRLADGHAELLAPDGMGRRIEMPAAV